MNKVPRNTFKIPMFDLCSQKDSSCSSDTNLEEEQKMDDDIDEELDEARSLTARYVQRSPTVPIKVQCHLINLIGMQYQILGTVPHNEATDYIQSILWLAVLLQTC